MADEFAVLGYREIVTIEAYERIPEFINDRIRRKAMRRLLDECLEIDADFNTKRVRESWNWLDKDQIPCSKTWYTRTYREYRYQLIVEKGSRFLR